MVLRTIYRNAKNEISFFRRNLGHQRGRLRLRNRYLDNFIFIHINKTGGSSIEKALNLPFEHLTASEKIRQIGLERWNSRYTFAVVRNPWDKVVSHYFYRVQTNQTNMGNGHISFEDWVRLAYGDKDSRFYDKKKMFMPQLNWISNSDDEIIVDFICRFEKLSNDFEHVCNRVGMPAELPHVKTSKRGDYRDYYCAETSEIVHQHFYKDIEKFNYSF